MKADPRQTHTLTFCLHVPINVYDGPGVNFIDIVYTADFDLVVNCPDPLGPNCNNDVNLKRAAATVAYEDVSAFSCVIYTCDPNSQAIANPDPFNQESILGACIDAA
jgi:hypothetical protein